MHELPPQHWVAELRKLTADLASLNTATEKDFLAIGAHLGELSGQAREITSMATETGALLGSIEMDKNAETLASVLRLVEEHLVHSGQGMAKSVDMLERISTDLTAMDRPMAGFKAIVKRLKVLGVSTKIESSRLTGGDNGFYTLAHDVENLSEVIDTKSSHILGRLQSLKEMVRDMLRRMVRQDKHEKGERRSVPRPYYLRSLIS